MSAAPSGSWCHTEASIQFEDFARATDTARFSYDRAAALPQIVRNLRTFAFGVLPKLAVGLSH